MSPKHDKTVRQIVEKYRKQFSILERPLLRRLIRVEHPTIFQPESSKLKTLDRELKRSFKITPYTLLTISSKLMKERCDILGDPKLYEFQDVLQFNFDLGMAEKKHKKQPINIKELIETARKETKELYEAHKEIREVVKLEHNYQTEQFRKAENRHSASS